VIRVLDRKATPDAGFDPFQPDPGRSRAPYRVFNIGNHDPVEQMDFIEAIENALGRRADKNFLPIQPGDVPATYADVSELGDWVNFRPATAVRDGVERFVAWYRNYYGV
jgi:UDP-glucuronate 4-epimerase